MPSASLVPRADDRSTLLTTAGMQPQMPYFLGLETPPAPLTVTAQKCFRTPDIDEVGNERSLTFFEMLGNFSFGQYFKEGAIELATEFVRERMQLDWDRVWATRARRRPAVRARARRGRDRALEEDRHAGRADRPAAELGELLVGRRPGAVRAGLGAPLRPRREVRVRRARLRDRLHALRALPRVLEPRLHGVRAARRRHAHAAPEAEHRHRAGPRARRARSSRTCRPCTRPTATRRSWSGSRRESGVAYGDSPEATKAHRILADHGRGHDVPRRGRRDAVERGPRLRPPPDHPARGAAGAADRPRGRAPADGRSSSSRWATRTPSSRSARPRSSEPCAWRRRVPRDDRARPQAVRGARRKGRDLGRGGVHARGDVRVPARADRRARGGARPGGRRRRLPARDGATPRGLARAAAAASSQRALELSRARPGSRPSSSATARPMC